MKFHRKGLWALAALVLILVVASGHTVLGVMAIVVAGTILELLTWRGRVGRAEKAAKPRRSNGPRLFAGI